jgi:15-cis-phytoene synthase
MTPDEYCQQRVAARGSSLYYGVLFLPAEQRRALIALHALNRELRDAVDEAADPGVARAKLAYWRIELHAAIAGSPQHPVARAIAVAARAHAMGEPELEQVVDGAQMDLDCNRYPDFAALEAYCRQTAGAVQLLCAKILGYTRGATQEGARTLGVALRLTEIIRDVGRDAGRGRVYLPLDELARFGLTGDDILQRREDKRFEQVMAIQIEHARAYHERAAALLPPVDRRAQRAGLVLAAISRALLEEIAALRGRTLTQSVTLTPVRKLWIAWKTWVAG